jgi:putative metallopeptidase
LTVYSYAPEIDALASDLIRTHHKHLMDVRVVCVWRDKAAVSFGRRVPGNSRLIAGLPAMLADKHNADSTDTAESFFVLDFARDVWEVMDEEQRLALVDHQLCYCRTDAGEDGRFKPVMTAPEIAEFPDVIERHGMWRPEVEALAKAVSGQLSLLDAS